MMLECAALVGIDWSDAKHDVCLLDCASGQRQCAVVEHSPATLDQWADSLRRRYPGQQVAVCLEQARGPLVYALLKYDFLTLYPVNPKTLAKFREAFTTSRAKDDPSDAAYLADLTAVTYADVIRGRVVGIADGDTVTVLDASKTRHRIRLQGIDAPESRQAFGARSKQHLSDLVYDREVSVECEK